MRLRAGYMVAAIGIASVMLASLVMFAVESGRSEHADRAALRAELLADVILNSFLAHSHAGGNPDVVRFLDYFTDSESRAGGVVSVRLLDPGGADNAYSRILLDRESEILRKGFSTEGLEVLDVTRAIVNMDKCRKCHVSDGDVLAFLSVRVAADGAAARASFLSDKLVAKGLTLGLIMVALLGASALIFKERKTLSQGSPDTDASGTGTRGGFGSLFAWLNPAGKQPDDSSIQSMEKVDKMATIGELSSAIAHEIKNPLAGISGAIQVLFEGFDEDDPRREVVEEVLAEIGRMDKTVKDLMSFARPPEPSFIRIPVMAIVEQTIGLVAGRAKKQFVDVSIESTDTQAVVLADPDQIQQVLQNIIMNAFQVMPSGGTLKVAQRVLATGREVEVAISDTGSGIKGEDIKYIFEPFFTTRSSGTGLGLAICRSIIERHGGSVKVDSTLGSGTTFTIRLPLEEKLDV